MSRAGFALFVVLFCCGILEDDRYAQMLAQKAFGNQDTSLNPDGSLKEKIALSRAAESLSERIAHSKEYEVVSETAKEESSKKPVFESWIWSSEYNDALFLESELIKQYQGKSLEDAISGR